MEILKVASSTNPNKLAGALSSEAQKEGKTALKCIGAGAINQGVKAIAIARGYVASAGNDLISKPVFDSAEINGEEKTAIKILIELV